MTSLHIGVLGLGILLFGFASFMGLAYLIAHHRLKAKRMDGVFRWLPPLDRLDRVAMRCLLIGFVLLTVGLVSGIYLAHGIWSRHWTQDPMVVLSFGTWGWYVLLFAVRFSRGWRGVRFFVLNVLGFFFLLLAAVGTSIWFGSVEHKPLFSQSRETRWI